MATKKIINLICILLGMVGTKAFAYDIEVENADGITIYYNYINDATELEVAPMHTNIDGHSGNSYNKQAYKGYIVIPEEVTYMNNTRKVTKIGNWAFYNCENLRTLTMPNSVTHIGEGAFSRCTNLDSIKMSENITRIDDRAFDMCYVDSITIPNSVTYIGSEAFANSGIETIFIGNGVKSIGNGAFSNCLGLSKVIISDIAAWCQIQFSDFEANPIRFSKHIYSDKTKEITTLSIPDGITTIGNWAFQDCEGLTSLTIPTTVTTIEENAFAGCSGLESLLIGSNVKEIKEGAFLFCSSLTSIDIPNSVTTIESSAFESCKGLTTLIIGSGVTDIGKVAFSYCDIPTITSKIENPFEIDEFTFSNNTFLNATLYVPDGTIDKYRATKGWKKFFNIQESTPSGIHNIEDDETNEIQRYTLDGRIIKNSHKGINIIQMKNGTTKKVLVK